MFSIVGELKVKSDVQRVSEKFMKRDLVLTEASSQYPQYISFQLTQDRVDLLDAYNVGDTIRVFFNLRGREWKSPQGETKFFNTLECWKLELVTKSYAPTNNPNQQQKGTQVIEPDVTTFTSGESDDLPF